MTARPTYLQRCLRIGILGDSNSVIGTVCLLWVLA